MMIVEMVTGRGDLQFNLDLEPWWGMVFLTSQSLCLVESEGRVFGMKKSSLDLAGIELMTLSIRGRCLTLDHKVPHLLLKLDIFPPPSRIFQALS
jgi:hypothetical protein